MSADRLFLAAVAACLVAWAGAVPAQAPSSGASSAAGVAATVPTGTEGKLFAVEFRTGPGWDASRPPHEQAYFREHSGNLRQLREQGHLVLGARHGDKGLIVVVADSEAAARAMIEQDPAVRHGTFRYELNEFLVFYGGAVQPPRR